MIRKTLLLVPLLFTLACTKKDKGEVKYVANVGAEHAVSKRIPLMIQGIGHFVAYNSVEIKAQVEGYLMKLHFDEGQFVNEDDLLFTIDPRPYEANLEKAIAERVQALAKLQYAAEKVARYQTLLPDNYVSVLDFIKFQSDLADFEGVVMEKDAEIKLAQINLDFCYIKAPFPGITGKKLIDIGNLITNDGSSLLVVKQIDPIFIDFSLPERDFLKIARYFKDRGLDVEIEFPDHPNNTFTARLLLVDNEIKANTGMIPLRAQICNETALFWPGQFIRANLIVTYIDNAILVPESAVQIGQIGQYVYVIDKDKKAQLRKVSVGEQVGNQVQIVEGSVLPGELVITEGQLSVRPGIECNVTNKG